jgi:transposase
MSLWISSFNQPCAEARSTVQIQAKYVFHLRDGDTRLPERVRIIDLPPYNPELNPCEQLWDVIKDDTNSHK